MTAGRLLAALALIAAPLAAQDTASVRVRGDSVRVRFMDAELRGVVQLLSGFLDKPLFAMDLPAARVSFETPTPVSRSGLPVLLRGLVESYGLVWVDDSSFYRIRARVPEAPEVLVRATEAAAVLRLFVHRLKHARAADVAATINLLFGGVGEFGGRSGLSSATLSDELRRNNVPPAEAAAPNVVPDRGARATLAGPMTMVPDEQTNSLLIRAAETDFEILRSTIEQLDIRPLQVLIEVLIVEARRDRSFSLGVSADYKKTDGSRTYQGGFGDVGAGDLVVQFMRMARSEVTAILSAAQARGDVEITSRPVLLASNNTEARFLVGSQRPFVQVSRSLPTDTPSRDQVVQYRDVGTKLTVRPTINQDGYVSLLVQQEISGATDESQFGAPVISTREARTQVLVKDGQTIVIGGLKDQQRDRVQSGVPVLSGIPIIGGLFGSSRRRSVGTELFLFLTPRIIRSDADVDSVTTPRLRQVPEGLGVR